MAKLKKLEDYREEIEHCVKCGACRAHCPAFGAEKHEGQGKIAQAYALLKFGGGGHDTKAKHCKHCGAVLNPESA